MPILPKQEDIFPLDLFEIATRETDPDRQWWCLYTRSRREKELMRRLRGAQVGYFCPTIEKRSRSPQGRIRTSFIPLFPNYVFLFGSPQDRLEAQKSNCVSQIREVLNASELVTDLQQIYVAVQTGTPLTPEAKLVPGDRVRVRSGPFRGYEGTVMRREGRTRLLLSVRYLEQGVSMEVDEGLLEPL